MRHLTRWRTVGPTAATAALTAGAFGIVSVGADPQPVEPIELRTEDAAGDAVDDDTDRDGVERSASSASPPSRDSPASSDSPPSPDSTPSPDSPASVASQDSMASPAEPVVSPRTEPQQSPAPPPVSVDSPSSIDS